MNRNIILFMISLLICSGCTNSKKLELKSKSIEIEYGKTISFNKEDYLENEKSILDDTFLQTDIKNQEGKDYPAVGDYILTLTYKKESANVEIHIKDTTAPVIKNVNDLYVLKLGERFDDKNIQYEDLSETKMIIDDSKVDYSKEGEYKILIKAEDIYENKTEKATTVKVIQPSITFHQHELTLEVNKKSKLQSTISGSEEKPVYSSSNSKIADVDSSGIVSAKKEGTVKVTAKIGNVSDSCTVTVKSTETKKTKKSEVLSSSNSQKQNKPSQSSSTQSTESKKPTQTEPAPEKKVYDLKVPYINQYEAGAPMGVRSSITFRGPSL